jgi:hypothetical protein
MVDLSSLSDTDLEALAQGNLSGMSSDGLSVVAGQPRPEWNLGDAAKQLASGAVEGTLGLGALLADVNPFAPMSHNPLNLPASRATQETIAPFLAPEDEQYRYTRTAGQFIGPGGVLGAAGKVLKQAGKLPALSEWLMSQMAPRVTAQAAGGAVAAQAAEDITGDSKIAPLIAALFGGATVSAVDDLYRGGKAIMQGGATAKEIAGSAKEAFGQATGLQADDIAQAIKARPADDLGALMTTAELTDNAGAAQIEKTLGASGPSSGLYNARAIARESAREKIIEGLSSTKAVNPEDLGSRLMSRADEVSEMMATEAKNVWEAVPRNVPIDISKTQATLNSILRSRQGGLQPGSKVRELAGQLLNEEAPDAVRTLKSSGALQDIRSDALALTRDANITPFEERILTAIHTGVDDAMGRGLTGEDYDLWQVARQATAQQKQTFGRSSAGGSLTADSARPANVLTNALKGDTQSVKELRAAIRNEPTLIEDVKRGVLDTIRRDSQENLTPFGMKKFVERNQGMLKELFGEDQYKAMGRILEDLQSEAGVSVSALRASKGNSVTAQRQTVAGALSDLVSQAALPGSGPLAAVLNNIREVGNLRTRTAINELLFRASMEPEFALELVKAPTRERVMSLAGRLWEGIKNAAIAGGRADVLELARTEPGAQVEQKEPRGAGAQGKSATKGETKTSLPKVSNQGSQPSEASSIGIDRSSLNSRPNPAVTQAPGAELISSMFSPSSRNGADLINTVFGGAMDEKPNAKVVQVEQEIDADPYFSALYEAESGRNPSAKNPESSASGGFQFIKSTAKALGVSDPLDLGQSFKGVKKLTDEHREKFGNDPVKLYAAHYLGSTVLNKWLDNKPLSEEQAAQIRFFKSKALPRFLKIYERIVQKRTGQVEA